MFFLEDIILKLGFSKKWTRLIMKCVRTVSYSILLNGQLGEHIFPYLFFICVEALSLLLLQFELKGKTRGITVTGGN